MSISDNIEIGAKNNNQDSNVNKKRQELSDQLKQISLKIDKEIYELKKQNNPGTPTSSTSKNKAKETFGNYYNYQNNARLKTPEHNDFSSKIQTNQSKQIVIHGRDSLNTSHDYSSISKNTVSSNVSTSKDKNILR